MGIIVNGFLIGSKKSAGGINFYKRMGKTCFRNKPTLSKDYVPSSAQMLQRDVMKFCGNLAKATENNLILMKGGWGGNKKSTGETNYNNIVRALVYGITRDYRTGEIVTSGDAAANLENAKTMGGKYFATEMPLTRSVYKEFPLSGITMKTATAAPKLDTGMVSEYKNYLAANFSREYLNDIAPRIVVFPSDSQTGGLDLCQIVEQGGTVAKPATSFVAVAFARESIASMGKAIDWAISEAVEVTWPSA